MQKYMDRVIAERDALGGKLTDLSAFIAGKIFLSLSDEERARLVKQVGIMKDYHDILSERIEAALVTY